MDNDAVAGLTETNDQQYVDLNNYFLNARLAKNLPEKYARRFKAIILDIDKDGGYLIGMVNPQDLFAADELTRVLRKPFSILKVREEDLEYRLDQVYRRGSEIEGFTEELASELQSRGTVQEADRATDPAVVKLLQSIFEDALQVSASDIHIEPEESYLRIRMRVDGLLQEQKFSVKGKEYVVQALTQRLKLLAGLNIAERRLPQDGRFDIDVYDSRLSVRLSTMPVRFGEALVMRLLRKNARVYRLDDSGMDPEMLERFRHLIRLANGIILVTGPTGSGKTTTLYGALSEINDVSKNIITIEDPIEYLLDGANQVQVNSQIGLTFGRVLRAVLRQDPDVLLVGEIRDQETAEIALRAAMTGHMVFATLHTNDAPSSVARLVDIGVESFLVASTVVAVLAQRLLRKICPRCAVSCKISDNERLYLSSFFSEEQLNREFAVGKGCEYCGHTGYKGLLGVFDLLELTYDMKETLRREGSDGFMNSIGENGRLALIRNAFQLALEKKVSLAEIIRVVGV